MAAEAQRAPRVARGLTSMSAAAAVARVSGEALATDMTAAWAIVFQACRGKLTIGERGSLLMGIPAEFDGVSEVVGTTRIMLANEEQQIGALRALVAVLDLCDRPTRDDVFAFANTVREG